MNIFKVCEIENRVNGLFVGFVKGKEDFGGPRDMQTRRVGALLGAGRSSAFRADAPDRDTVTNRC